VNLFNETLANKTILCVVMRKKYKMENNRVIKIMMVLEFPSEKVFIS